MEPISFRAAELWSEILPISCGGIRRSLRLLLPRPRAATGRKTLRFGANRKKYGKVRLYPLTFHSFADILLKPL